MRRRFFGTLLWLFLLPIVGFGKLLWFTLLLLPRLRLRTLMTFVGLIVAVSLPGPVAATLSDAGVWPLGQVILLRGAAVLSVPVLWFGLRSRGLWRLLRWSWRAGSSPRRSRASERASGAGARQAVSAVASRVGP